MHHYKANPNLDLVLERTLDLPVEKVWEAWTHPEHVKAWFAPKPWVLGDCKMDLRPGGWFYTVMKGPEGQEFAGNGCILQVIPHELFSWTDALKADFRPSTSSFFTARIEMERDGQKTKYRAIAMHVDEAGKKQHEEMGFVQGWGICLDQLVAHMKGL